MLTKLLSGLFGLFLLLLNFMVITEYDQDYSRWARLMTTSAFLVLLLIINPGMKRLLSVFSLFVLADMLLFYYEYHLFNALTFLVRISAYVMLIMVVIPELKKLRTNNFQKMIFVIGFSLNLAMLVMLVDMVPETFRYQTMEILFYGYGLAMIAMVIAAISYSNRYSSKRSFFFTSATLCLVFSDITSFIAYYLDFHQFYFADRFFYLMALAGLVKFSSIGRNHRAVTALESL
ncbi:hypothetical protein E0K83_00595 [Gramella sp. BOM4]|nr:hypothetical protein [Christiangramia bathymodioli]